MIGAIHVPPLNNIPSWCIQRKIGVYPEVYKSTENELALLILIDYHPTGKYYINSVAFSPRANHTDRAAAAGRRS
jgi:hypothetical protein